MEKERGSSRTREEGGLLCPEQQHQIAEATSYDTRTTMDVISKVQKIAISHNGDQLGIGWAIAR